MSSSLDNPGYPRLQLEPIEDPSELIMVVLAAVMGQTRGGHTDALAAVAAADEITLAAALIRACEILADQIRRAAACPLEHPDPDDG